MKKTIALIMLCVMCLCIVPQASLAADSGFSAELRVDNTVDFKWSAQQGATLNIYGYDNEGDVPMPLLSGIDAGSGSYRHDFMADNTTFYNYYKVDVLSGAAVTNSVTVETYSVFPRVSKEITNEQHPNMVTTVEKLERAKALINAGADENATTVEKFYRRSFDNIKKSADGKLTDEGMQTVLANGITSATEGKSMCSALASWGFIWSITGEEKYLEASRTGFLHLVDYIYDNQKLENEMQNDQWHLEPCLTAYDLIYNGLTEVDRQVIENGLIYKWMYRIVGRAEDGKGTKSGAAGVALGIRVGLMLQDHEELIRAVDGIEGVTYSGSEGVKYCYKYMLGEILNDDGTIFNYPTMYMVSQGSDWFECAENLYNSGYDVYNYNISATRQTSWNGETAPIQNEALGDIVELEGKNALKNLLDGYFYYVYPNLSYLNQGDSNRDTYKLDGTLADIMEYAVEHWDDSRAKFILNQRYRISGTKEERNTGVFSSLMALLNADPQIGEGKYSIGSGQWAPKAYNRLGSTMFLDHGLSFIRQPGMAEESTASTLFWKKTYEPGHGHNDSMNITVYGGGKEMIFDPGRFNYGSQPELYGKSTLAHNTMIIDKTVFQYPAYTAEDFYFTSGVLESAAIGPVSSAVKARTDKLYENIVGKGILDRTMWQVDDYIVDMFTGKSEGTHTYDYLLNINGDFTESSLRYSDMAQEPLGEDIPFKFVLQREKASSVDTMWTNTYTNTDDNVRLKLTMLGEDDTEVILGDAINISSEYIEEKLIVRRTAEDETTFINVIEPLTEEKTPRTVAEIPVKLKGKVIDWSEALTVTNEAEGVVDTFMHGVSYGVREAGHLTSDADSAFLRQINGEDTVLGGTSMKYISGDKVGLKFSARASAQLTKQDDNTWRLDMGHGEQIAETTTVSVFGLPSGLTVYKAELSDELNTIAVNVESGYKFKAEAGGIYIISSQSRSEVNDMKVAVLNVNKGVADEYDPNRILNVVNNEISTIDALPQGIIIEAEDYDVQKRGKVTFTTVQGDSHSTANESGTAFYGWDNSGHELTWNVDLPSAGKYRLAIRYATAASGSQRLLKINDEEPWVLSFDVTGGWGIRKIAELFNEDNSPYVVELKEGTNTIKLTNINAALNMDCMVLIPVN